MLKQSKPWLAALGTVLLAACSSLPGKSEPVVPAAPDNKVIASAPVASTPPVPVLPLTPPVVKPPQPLTPPKPKVLAQPRIALALGGGAAKGFAHVGVIRVLEANGIRPDIITGTSAGAVVGAIYASGKNAEQLRKRALALNPEDLKDFTLSGNSVFKGAKLAAFVNREVGRKKLEQLPRRFGAVATDFDTGARVVFRVGDTGTAVRASAAIPNVFEPVVIKGRRYVDGGLVSPVPAIAAREMGADIVIAVDISSRPAKGSTPGMLGNLNQSIAIMTQAALAAELRQADVVLRPQVLGIAAADFSQRSRAMREGERVARQGLPVIRQAISNWQTRQP